MPTVSVTPEDIAAGVRGSASGCPLAAAVARLVPDGRRVAVVPIRPDRWVVRVYDRRGRCRSAFLPPDVCRWLDAYVRGEAVGPISFDLTLEESR
jgi:hypothetical protein